LLSACVAAVAVGPPLLEAEPLRTQTLHSDGRPDAGSRGWSRQTADTQKSRALGNASGRVASAITPLDLRQLSMSDFGDIEQKR
jgi:hypothetical protein